MFGNLIESNPHRDDYARKSSFFFGTLAVYALAFLAIGVGSIYAYSTHFDVVPDMKVISMITLPETSEASAPQRSALPRAPAGSNNSSREVVVRTKPVFATTDPTRAVEKAVVSSSGPELPPGTIYRIGTPDPNSGIFGDGKGTPGPGGGGNGPADSSRKIEELVKDTPPPAMKIEKSTPVRKVVKNIGVVNGNATFLPKPAYTAIAKAARASGTVTVQVLIDESGKVVSARAVSGHPLLLAESVQAAYRARFTPTLLSNQPVKVSGVITYNFVLG